ncbi:HAMP domain-containing histidine kinase [Microbispora sp. RL4-1S]|uniref:Signal transduction histidine-protein kinase/phosphatase MprB n=1 Tax=Microbispora oryzae TaxID=2806554 RepID=A0A940WGX2_9ACTN|nr:HAMP domain-containing sensor histidine kinase [Microbispora oryzae]MBP2704588.1 HAMP domain-containing histidine kinase [Microbispora oryzae]
MDLPGEWLILLWPLPALLTWIVVVKGLLLLLAGRYRPRSLRGQITVLVTVVAVVTLLTADAWVYAVPQAIAGRWPVVASVALMTRYRVADSWEWIVLVGIGELIALAGLATWKVTGRLLRPVEKVRTELAVIEYGDLPVHVAGRQPAREFDRLFRTLDRALDRVHATKLEQTAVARRQWKFASDVSHELRTPIAGLRAQLEDAQEDPRARLTELLRTTLRQVARLETITDDVLRLALAEDRPPQAPRRVDLAALVRTEVAQRSDRIPVQLRLAHDAVVDVVPTQIGRLLANLLNNAQRHAAGLVLVEVRSTHAAVELAVGDDGAGVAEADRERVFQRFTRLAEARRRDPDGTGLGLAIARDIAHAHHGTLTVEESDLGGARFVFRLPRSRRRGTG